MAPFAFLFFGVSLPASPPARKQSLSSMSAASKACQQQAKHVSSKQSMSAASKACQQQAKHVSSK
jgi:hypothetical protein